MQHRTVVLAAISLFLLGWGGITLGGGVPDAAGGGPFCDVDAPTNIYCQDFEVVGSNCTLEDPAMNENSADCGYTTTVLSGVESMEVTGSESESDQGSYTHSNKSCHTFCFRVHTKTGTRVDDIYMGMDDADGTFPRLEYNSVNNTILMRCDSSTSSGTTAAVVGTSYWIELGYTNQGEIGTFFVNDTQISTCDGGQAGSADDNGWRTPNVLDVSFIIDNIHITTDETCAATMPTGACDPL